MLKCKKHPTYAGKRKPTAVCAVCEKIYARAHVSPSTGTVKARRWEVRPIPKGRAVYILTSAQNNTDVHLPVWDNLRALAKHDGAEIMVATFTYDTLSQGASHAKRKTSKEKGNKGREEWWAEEIIPFIQDRSIEIAPGLVWCGELQILPTAVDPLSGYEAYTGTASSIIPHTKFSVQSVASPKSKGTKFLYTTGTVTKRNYIQKKAGQKAEFHHGYGALIVEVDSEGTWFVRQLNADSDGVIYDLGRKVENGKVTNGHRPEAIVWGDIHVRQLEADMVSLAWGKGGILDTLKPKIQVMHDFLDFRSKNHHERNDPWKNFEKFMARAANVQAELEEAAEFLVGDSYRDWCQTVVVSANHDLAFQRWLKEGDFKSDPENARFFLRANLAAYDAMARGDKSFYVVEWAVLDILNQKYDPTDPKHNIRFLRRDEFFAICPEAGGGIELDMHGDKGANGGKGNLRTFARAGRKCIVGDSHTAGHFEGAMQVGVMGSLEQGYNEGMSSWSHTNAIVYPNGKRTLFTIYDNKWRA